MKKLLTFLAFIIISNAVGLTIVYGWFKMIDFIPSTAIQVIIKALVIVLPIMFLWHEAKIAPIEEE